MHFHQQSQNHLQSSYQHHVNHVHTTYRCYIRTSDMRCKIENISTDQSVSELKQQVVNIINLNTVAQPSAIKLVVNETQLTDDMNLALHLFQNAIIHVLVSQSRNSQDINSSIISIKIKQPSFDSQSYTLENIPLNLNVKQLKSTIIQFYSTQQQSNPIGKLAENDLYLVYGGRILTDDKTVSDYDIDQNGILCVVNGKIYAKQVTKEQAQKRIQQVRKGQSIESQAQPVERQELPQQSSQLNGQQQDIVFNIIQNIVHDEDSDVEGQTANDIGRSQKFIQRYDSINRKLPSNDQDDHVITGEQGDRNSQVDEQEEFKQQISQHLSQLNEQISRNQENQNGGQQQDQAEPQQEKCSTLPAVQHIEQPFSQREAYSENIEGTQQGQQVQPDYVPHNEDNQDEDMLM